MVHQRAVKASRVLPNPVSKVRVLPEKVAKAERAESPVQNPAASRAVSRMAILAAALQEQILPVSMAAIPVEKQVRHRH